MEDFIKRFLESGCCGEIEVGIKPKQLTLMVEMDDENFKKFLDGLSCRVNVTVQEKWKELGIQNYEPKRCE